MTETVVLRFRDFEAETVEVHDALIGQTGATWWAWWKKDSEADQLDGLRALTGLVPVEVGLVNRERDTRYVATCGRIVFSPDGARLSSPEPSRTPEYYRGAQFPAWFLLSKIEQVGPAEWERRFGSVPTGEPTLFLIPEEAEDPARAELYRRYAAKPVRLKSSAILHLSDLHFGDDYAFPLLARDVPTLQQTLDEAIADGLEQMGVGQVGLVVISGDITTQGKGFQEAKAFVTALLDKLRLTPEQLVVVPGNHDIELDSTKATRNYAAEQPFRDFLQLIHNNADLELNRLAWFSAEDGRDIFVLALNSVRPRAKSTMEYGYVGRDLYGPLLERAKQLRDEVRKPGGPAPISLAVLHHHVLPTPLVEDPDELRPVSLTLDAGQLIEDLQRAGFDAILHGHQHVPFVGNTARSWRLKTGDWELGRPIHVVGGGSCGVKVGRLWNQMRDNSLGVYTPADGKLDLRMFRFAPGVQFEDLLRLSLPLAGSG
ncbi:metallophosphoesterase [Streptomyces sp. SID13031]|uniref:metallophosphoesterase family protein n=1 Tax=Streptomyces sp. SID13031 TaxID=2706046 RepID=UPI0013CB62FE|nr:metallophosphoesterase [Streptomyces sp. SID13031]NEA32644.1 hypothetical protein [Streptomyces sp. SID13031]